MLRCLLLLVILFVVGVRANDYKTAFVDFLKTYNLTYEGPEYSRRFGIFSANFIRIQGLKASGHGGVGLNRFADRDPSEFQRLLLPVSFEESAKHKNRTAHGKRPPTHARRSKRQTLPTSLDYRSNGWVTPVRDQGQCGSCWAFAAVAGMETVYKLFTVGSKDFSEQELVDCEPHSSGCGGGWTDNAVDYIYSNGMATEAAYPYTASDGTCKNVSKPYKSVYYYYLNAEADIPYHVYTYGPVAFCFRVPGSFQYYAGGVFNPADCTNKVGLHEMLIVGYTPTYWIVKNSWGTGFGVSGYVYFARGKNLCNMASELLLLLPASLRFFGVRVKG